VTLTTAPTGQPPHAPSPERVETRDETSVRRVVDEMLFVAAHGNVDPDAHIGTILALIEQGCDPEADILPVIAREVPELPRPLKNWGAP
jgi:hypothetical protein